MTLHQREPRAAGARTHCQPVNTNLQHTYRQSSRHLYSARLYYVIERCKISADYPVNFLLLVSAISLGLTASLLVVTAHQLVVSSGNRLCTLYAVNSALLQLQPRVR